MPVDAYASEPHYARHIAPLWEALEHDERGTFYTGRGAAPYVTRHLIKGPLQIGPPITGDCPVLCSAHQDSRFVRSRDRQVIYLEHGAGQTYEGDIHGRSHPSYSGGRDHMPGTACILTPGPRSANNWRQAYPELDIHEIGPVYLDPWLSGDQALPANDPPVVAISFHANVRLCPETQWSFPYYDSHVLLLRDELAEKGIQLLGHAHPRIWKVISAWYDKHGIPAVENFTEVLERADLYVCDNSSTLYEFAATGRPVVALNSPQYRRQINHGLRFWDFIPGLECNRPAELTQVILQALQDPPEAQDKRARAVAEVYHPLDGGAIQRGVSAIRSCLGRVDSLRSSS